MFNIEEYLSKFKVILKKDGAIKGVIKDVLDKELKTNISKEDIKISQGIIFLKAPPILKSEILLRKNKILEKISNKIGSKKIQDIR